MVPSIFPSFLAINITDLLDELEDHTIICVCADDMLTAVESVITTLSWHPYNNNNVAWSAMARLTLNLVMCETAFLSLDCAEAARHPSVTTDIRRTLCNSLQIYLGVRYHWRLTIGKHVRKLYQSMTGLINLHLTMADTNYG